VVLTASAPAVWVKVTDAAGNQLFQKEMAQGESFTVPADAQNPQLRTARADVLQITVGGRELPRLSDKPQVLSGVVLTPAALVERTRGAPAPAAAATPAVRADVPPVPKLDAATAAPGATTPR
jgi:hypothetical protein